MQGRGLLPDGVEYGRQDQLVVHGDGHVSGLVERRRHRAHGVTQVHRPQQEERLGYGEKKKEEEEEER